MDFDDRVTDIICRLRVHQWMIVGTRGFAAECNSRKNKKNWMRNPIKYTHIYRCQSQFIKWLCNGCKATARAIPTLKFRWPCWMTFSWCWHAQMCSADKELLGADALRWLGCARPFTAFIHLFSKTKHNNTESNFMCSYVVLYLRRCRPNVWITCTENVRRNIAYGIVVTYYTTLLFYLASGIRHVKQHSFAPNVCTVRFQCYRWMFKCNINT